MLAPTVWAFICYSHEDSFAAHNIIRSLRKAYIQETIDIRFMVGGDAIKERLEQVIKESQVMLFLASLSSVKSDWCSWERQIASKYDIPILPVKLEPSVEIPADLADLNWLSLGNEDPDGDLLRLVGSIYRNHKSKAA